MSQFFASGGLFWNFSFSISPSHEYSGLISFKKDWLDLLVVQGLSRVFSNTTVQKHQVKSLGSINFVEEHIQEILINSEMLDL